MPQRVPVRSSEGRPSSSEVRIFMVRPQVTWRPVRLAGHAEIIRNHQKSSDITNHQTSMSNHLRTWKNPLATYATWGQLDNIGLRFFHFSFADTCRKRFDPSTSSTLPGHNEVPSWWYSATRSERHTGSPRPMRRWWTVGTWLHQLFCGKRMMSMTADDMYICIPSAYLT